jgi:hypothetical protein
MEPREVTGLYVKTSVSLAGKPPGRDFPTLAVVQVLSNDKVVGNKDEIQPPPEAYKKERAGYGPNQKNEKSLGWFVDVFEDATNLLYPESFSGDYFDANKQRPCVMWDATGTEQKDTGKTFYTCLIGSTGLLQWKFIAGVKWGYYIAPDGTVKMRPEKPEPISALPAEVRDAIDRWGKMKNVRGDVVK